MTQQIAGYHSENRLLLLIELSLVTSDFTVIINSFYGHFRRCDITIARACLFAASPGDVDSLTSV